MWTPRASPAALFSLFRMPWSAHPVQTDVPSQKNGVFFFASSVSLSIRLSVCVVGSNWTPFLASDLMSIKSFRGYVGVLELYDTSQVFRQNTITSPLIFKKSFLSCSQNLMQPSTSEWSRASDCDEGSSWPVGARKWIIIFQWHGQIVHEVW